MNIKKFVAIGTAVVAVSALALDYVEVTGVKARQRYPWNGLVDIDFTLDSKATEPYLMNVVAYDNVGKTNLPVRSVFTENISYSNNPCMVSKDATRIVWDASADLPNGFKCSNVLVSCQDVRAAGITNLYMIVDLTGGSDVESYGVSYTNRAPAGGWSEDYLKTKLVFRRVEPQSFDMSYGKVTLTKPYYVGVNTLSSNQLALISGQSEANFKANAIAWSTLRGADVPATCSSTATSSKKVYQKIYYSDYEEMTNFTIKCSIVQNKMAESEAPYTADVESDSIIGRLRAKTGLNFDLPTEAQWKCSYLGGSLSGVAGESLGISISGTEWCLDFYGADRSNLGSVDPIADVPVYTAKTIYSGKTLAVNNDDGVVATASGYTYGNQYKIVYSTARVVTVCDNTFTFGPDVKTTWQSKTAYYKQRCQVTASLTVYGVSHMLSDGTSALIYNTTGVPFETGYYGVKGTAVTPPTHCARLVLVVDE